MSIIFDVGANDGTQFINIAKNDPSVMVYAFEPTPYLCKKIKSKINNMNNYQLVEKAVSDFEGTAKFNVSRQNRGCNSLLDFSDKSKTKWPGKKAFKVTKTIEVNVIRLDKFINEHDIKEIDHLRVDTQGSDLKVLTGLGEKISIVKKGTIKVASENDVLYVGQNTQDECVEFLVKQGFEIEKILPNDKYKNELNITFSRL